MPKNYAIFANIFQTRRMEQKLLYLARPIQKPVPAYISKRACISCRTHHLKCDGKAPCQQCKRKSVNCVFENAKKRGPKSKELRELVSVLSKECQELKDKLKNYELLFNNPFPSQIVNNPNNQEETIEESFEISRRMVNPNPLFPDFNRNPYSGFDFKLIYSGYIEKYFEFVHPNIPVLHPENFKGENLKLFLSEVLEMKEENSQSKIAKLQLNIILAISARVCENLRESKEYYDKAREYLGAVFDEQKFAVAESLILMAYYSYGEGDGYKAASYSAMASQICKTLGDSNSFVARKTLLSSALSEQVYLDRNQIFTKIQEKPNITIQEITYLSFIIVMNELVFSQNNQNVNELLKIVQRNETELDNYYRGFCNSQVEHLGEYISNRILLTSAKAALYWSCNSKEPARFWENEFLNLIISTDPRYFDFSVVLAIALVHRSSKSYDVDNNDILLENELLQKKRMILQNLSTFFPIAETILSAISRGTNVGFDDNNNSLHFQLSTIDNYLISFLGTSLCFNLFSQKPFALNNHPFLLTKEKDNNLPIESSLCDMFGDLVNSTPNIELFYNDIAL